MVSTDRAGEEEAIYSESLQRNGKSLQRNGSLPRHLLKIGYISVLAVTENFVHLSEKL